LLALQFVDALLQGSHLGQQPGDAAVLGGDAIEHLAVRPLPAGLVGIVFLGGHGWFLPPKSGPAGQRC